MDWTDIERFLSGEMNAEEAAAFREYIAREPEYRLKFDHARRIWGHAAGSSQVYDLHAGRDAIRAKLKAANRRARPTQSFRGVQVPSSPWRRYGGNIAVAAGLVIAAGITWYTGGTRGSPRTPSTPVVITTSRGEIATKTLDDGTQITIGPESRLTYAINAGRCGSRGDVCPRVFDINGEGAFNVVHHAGAPFVVRAAGVTVRVLGTRFGVRKYADDKEVKVIVASGKVAVADNKVLTGGTVARIAPDGRVALDVTSNTEALLDWTRGSLVFPSYTPLSDALPQLARWYNMDFVLAKPSLGTRRLIGRFPSTALTPAALDALAATLGVRYTRVGNTITLYPLTPEISP